MSQNEVKLPAGCPRLNLPAARFKVRPIENEDGIGIWDEIRRKWLVLTPEEWVRQHILRTLVNEMGVSPTLISQECPICVNGMPQRADIVVYGKDGHPLMLVECKAAGVGLSSSAYAQAVRYNNELGARYIFITDGLKHFIYESTGGGNYTQLKELPKL